jgi:hypothetical protein
MIRCHAAELPRLGMPETVDLEQTKTARRPAVEPVDRDRFERCRDYQEFLPG